MVVIVWWLDSITTEVVSSNPVHGEVYSIQHYVIKFVSDLGQFGGFLRTPIYSTNKTDRHDIIEILLLKVALNTINQIKPFCFLVHPEYNSVLIWLLIVFYISPLTFLLCSSQYCTVHSHCNNLVFSRSDFLVDNIKPLISRFPNNSTLKGEPSLAWPQNPPVKYFPKTYKNFENLLEQYQIFSFRYIFDVYFTQYLEMIGCI